MSINTAPGNVYAARSRNLITAIEPCARSWREREWQPRASKDGAPGRRPATACARDLLLPAQAKAVRGAHGFRGAPPPPYPTQAPVAQLDRAPDYEFGGREFESLRARH